MDIMTEKMMKDKALSDDHQTVLKPCGEEAVGDDLGSVVVTTTVVEKTVVQGEAGEGNGSIEKEKEGVFGNLGGGDEGMKVNCNENGVSVGMDVEVGENGSDLNAVLADENASVDPMDIGGSSEQNEKNGANFSQVFEIFGELWFKEEEEEMDKNDDVNVENGEDNGDEEYNREQAESEDHAFVVGDFVWGKIKSKLWWPGQIYDPSDASDNAAVLKQDAQLLVAYFGDRSFSWSSPRELKPFIDNFEEMSRQSDSKKFVNAVKKVLEEVGRGVEAELMCKCQSTNVTKNVGVVNNGIKNGARAPKGNTTKVLVDRINPVELVSNLTRYAIMQPGTRVGELELTVLKSCLRAFYTKKDGFLLVDYHDPKCIEEGTKSGDADTSGPSEGPENGDDKLYQRRKQKSVAELMGEDGKKAKTTKDGGIKDRKKKSLVVSVTPESGGGGGVEEETMSPRQRKKSRYLSPPYLSPIGIGSGKLSLLGLGTGTGSGSFKEPKPEPEKAPEMAAKQLDDTLKKSSEKKAREKRRVREGSDPQVHKKKKTDAAVSVGKVLDGLLRAAIDPSSFVQKDKNLATITELLSSFRSSIFKEGSSSQTGKKKDGEDTSELGFIKQKLEWMSEMVRTCEESEMNADVKTRLEGGFQEVLGKVVKMRGK